jgi:ankyrin repeat protein
MVDGAEEIQRACRLGDLGLLKRVADTYPHHINTVDAKLGWSPLYRAVICGHVEAARFLLKAGADPNLRNKVGEVPLHQAADSSSMKLAQVLLEHKADPNLQAQDGETPLHKAAKKGNHRMCWLLLKHKANPNVPNEAQGQTPLHLAVAASNKRVVQILLTYDASPVVRDRAGRQALDLVKSPEIEQLLNEPQVPQDPYDLSPATTPEPRDPEPEMKVPEAPQADVQESYKLETKEPEAQEVDLRDSFQLTFKPRNPEVIVPVTATLLPSPREDEEVVFERDVSQSPPGFKTIDVPTPDPIRTFSFGSDYKKSTLYMWLSNSKLDFLFESLVDEGFDDVEALVAQIQSQGVTLDTLEKVGIKKIGHRIRLLACLEEEVNDRRRASAPVAEVKPRPGPFQLCRAPESSAAAYLALPTLVQWLDTLKLKHLHSNFVTAGYEDLEHLLALMHTRFAITDEVLEQQLGITKLGYRHRLLLQLQEDAPRVTSMRASAELADPDPMLERETKAVACEMCHVM